MYDRSYYPQIKQSTYDALDRYAQGGVPVGGFLYAVLTNNLFDAVGRADSENRATLKEILAYVYNEPPSPCWGSPEKVRAWLKPAPEAAEQTEGTP